VCASAQRFALAALCLDKLDNQGGDGEAVQPEKGSGVENCLRLPQNPQRQMHALLGGVF